jgi:hypothetical protein
MNGSVLHPNQKLVEQKIIIFQSHFDVKKFNLVAFEYLLYYFFINIIEANSAAEQKNNTNFVYIDQNWDSDKIARIHDNINSVDSVADSEPQGVGSF